MSRSENLIDVHSSLEVLRSHSSVFERIREGHGLRATVTNALVSAVLGSAFFGLALGSHAQSLQQVLASAIKVPILLLGTAVLCFPTFHIFQTWRAPRPIALKKALALQATTLASVALIWASVAPPIIFLVGSTRDYKLAQFLALATGAVGGAIGLGRLMSGARCLCVVEGEQGSMSFLLLYFAVFSAVGGQLAWMLRPFIGSPSLPFQIFRDADPGAGNIFTHILSLFGM